MSDLVPLLDEFYQEKQRELLRHESGARLIGPYDVNNAYQYIINRETVQLSWLAAALRALGSAVPEESDGLRADGTARPGAGWRGVVEEDARAARAFSDRWLPRVEAMSNARHRRMLEVILGETLEQQRSFEQALAGRTDLLGLRGPHGSPAVGEVLSSRWTE